MPTVEYPEVTISGLVPTWLQGFEKEAQYNKRILCDIDGVICEYNFQSLVWDKFHARIDSTKIFAYNLADVLGVSSIEIDDMFYKQVWGRPQFNDGAFEVLLDWKTKGYEIAIFSNRIKYMGYKKLAQWLNEWQIPFSGIDKTGDRHDYDYHIDDRPEKLCDSGSKVKLLYSQPWNLQCLNIKRELTRVNSWEEIREIVG